MYMQTIPSPVWGCEELGSRSAHGHYPKVSLPPPGQNRGLPSFLPFLTVTPPHILHQLWGPRRLPGDKQANFSQAVEERESQLACLLVQLSFVSPWSRAEEEECGRGQGGGVGRCKETPGKRGREVGR